VFSSKRHFSVKIKGFSFKTHRNREVLTVLKGKSELHGDQQVIKNNFFMRSLGLLWFGGV